MDLKQTALKPRLYNHNKKMQQTVTKNNWMPWWKKIQSSISFFRYLSFH